MGMVVEEGEGGEGEGEEEEDEKAEPGSFWLFRLDGVLVCVGGVVGAESMPVDSNSSVLLEVRNMEKMDMKKEGSSASSVSSGASVVGVVGGT